MRLASREELLERLRETEEKLEKAERILEEITRLAKGYDDADI